MPCQPNHKAGTPVPKEEPVPVATAEHIAALKVAIAAGLRSAGHCHASLWHDDEVSLPDRWPLEITCNMPVSEGPARVPARVVRCLECNQEVWRSLVANDDIPAVCFDCADRYIPGWRDR